MTQFEERLSEKLLQLFTEHHYRQLPDKFDYHKIADFASNDYLGVARLYWNHKWYEHFPELNWREIPMHGATGSPLITGYNEVLEAAEREIAHFHEAEAALIFNSGYSANTGLLSCLPSRHDTVLFDEYTHASIRDGLRLSNAKNYSFKHNDIDDLRKKLKFSVGQVIIVVESVYSMDGDQAPLKEIVELCNETGAILITDEAHALGNFGTQGEGLIQSLHLHKNAFARVYTFGKAAGCHGAAVVGSRVMIQFLVNYSKPYIYSTAIPPASVGYIHLFYKWLRKSEELIKRRANLWKNTEYLEKTFLQKNLPLIGKNSPIYGILVPGNKQVTELSSYLLENHIDARPMRSPTVPEGKERIRLTLHSFNTFEQIDNLAECIEKWGS